MKEIVEKIATVQANIDRITDSLKIDIISKSNIVPSLEYYLIIASDLTKLIRQIVKSQKQISSSKVNRIFRELDPNGDLSVVAFEIFKRYVVFE